MDLALGRLRSRCSPSPDKKHQSSGEIVYRGSIRAVANIAMGAASEPVNSDHISTMAGVFIVTIAGAAAELTP